MGSPIEDEKFKQGLMQDLAQAQTQAQSGAVARGGPEDSSFAPRAIRINKRTVAEKELNDNKLAIDDTIKSLIQESGLVDELETAKFEQGLRKKMNQYQLFMIKQAGELDKRRLKEGLDAESSNAALGALLGVAKTATSTIVGNIGQKGQAPAAADVSTKSLSGLANSMAPERPGEFT